MLRRTTGSGRGHWDRRRQLCVLVMGTVLCAGVGAGVGAAKSSAAAPVARAKKSRRTAPTTGAAPTTAASSSRAAPPKRLISAEPIGTKIDGATGYLVRYRSQASNGEPIEVTGAAFVPDGTPPKDGWPLLSIAHGTTGLADACAPSSRLSFLELNVAKIFLASGIALVQTDYEGLGTPGRHPYLVGVSEGRGVLDIARAARELPGNKIGSRVVVWGHSQGGHSALFAGELAADYAPDLQLVGVVAGAPPSQLTGISASIETSPFRGYIFMVAAGLAAADPTLRLDQLLTPKGLETISIVDTGCTDAVFKAFASGSLSSYVNLDALTKPPWSTALARNEPGSRRTGAPILIVHGDRDEQIPIDTSAALLKKLCALGDNVERKVYPGASHAGAALTSLADVQRFVSDRFAGKPATPVCG